MNLRKIVKTVIPTGVFKKIEPTGHLVEAFLMNVRYGFPGKKLRVIGVTGTNGKTTTSFMIHRMLHEAGVKTALMSTVAYGVGDELVYPSVHMTTSKASVLQKRLRDFARQGVEWVVVETSSHSLAQHRVWGVPYEIAVITNLTHDHLEYHGSFEKYLDAKRQLFVIANKHGLRLGVANADDPSVKAFTDSIKNPVTYGIKGGDLRATKVKLTSTGSTYTVTDGDVSYAMRVNIPGEFNVSNSLAALVVGKSLGLTPQQIQDGVAALQSVEGRMNSLDVGQPFKVLIDFASTPDGFEKFFESVRPLVKGKLVAVFGSAGRRDETKRAQQGAIAAKYADELIITEEDDRDEDGAHILEQIAEGARTNGKSEDNGLYAIANREEAIGFAMTRVTQPDDMVVLLGKGHEKTIERANGEHPWNEKEVAKAALEALLSEKPKTL
jgi:UDP-N-acetylmuramoyl-L-alanyl-D-glutamate--2,6-diaminopimelate ligase